MHFLKKGQKIQAWVDPPPSFGQCPKENVFFFIEVFPNTDTTKYVSASKFPKIFLLLTIYDCIRLPPKRRWWEGTQLISNSILKSCLRPVRDCFSDYFIFSSWLAFYRGSDERHFLIRKDISYGLSTATVHRQLPFQNMKNKLVNLFLAGGVHRQC